MSISEQIPNTLNHRSYKRLTESQRATITAKTLEYVETYGEPEIGVRNLVGEIEAGIMGDGDFESSLHAAAQQIRDAQAKLAELRDAQREQIRIAAMFLSKSATARAAEVNRLTVDRALDPAR